MLDNEIVVFDVATTGGEITQGEIIEFAALRIRKGEVQSSCHFLFQPVQDINDTTLKLTGIKKEELDGALPIEEHSREIEEFFKDAVLVGHRVTILLSMLKKKLKINFQQNCWDTLELARIFFPTMHDYQLSYLNQKLSLSSEDGLRGHRAETNAWLTWKLLGACMKKSMAFDLSFFNQTKGLLDGWAGRGLIDDLHKEIVRRFPDRRIGTDFVLAPLAAGLFSEKKPAKANNPISIDSITDFFSPGGILERNLISYESRPGQMKMAKLIAEALTSSQHVVVEAGTGTGKSFAYLIPCLFSAKKTGQKVVVSTHTIPLQEQLQKKDIPVLDTILPFSFKVSVLKGKGNYCCLKKLQLCMGNPQEFSKEQKLALLSILVWLRETQTGDVQELSKFPGILQIWPVLNADNEMCIPGKCSQAGICFLLRARKKAEEADLLIVNHSLLFSDIKTDYNVLPEYHQLVIDEAHQIYKTALQQLGSDICLENVTRIMDSINKLSGGKGHVKQRWERLARLAPSDSWEIFEKQLAGIPENCSLIIEQAKELFQLLSQVLGNRRTFRLVASHSTQAWWETLAVQIENLTGRLKTISAVLESLIGALNEEDLDENEELKFVLVGHQRELKSLLDTLTKVLNIYDPLQVTWLEHNSRLYLKTSPIEVSDILKEKIFSRLDAVILTSATLSISGSFKQFLRDIGLSETTKTALVDSPFDYEQQMKFFVVNQGINLQSSDAENVQELSWFVAEVAERMNGRTLVLFTSHKLLQETYVSLHPKLAQIGIGTLAQGFHGERSKILEAFQQNPRSVLLGANSFWEGIDLPGATLTCVILVKLPFWPPSLPLIEARSEYFKSMQRNPFQELSLPEAVIRFKQGFGRLIRSKEDRGIVVLLDDRVVKKYYGRLFLNSLPIRTYVKGSSALILRKIEEWRTLELS